MRGIATALLLLSVGCAGEQQARKPGAPEPPPGFVASGTSEAFFTTRRGDDLLPIPTGEQPPEPAR